MLSKAIGELEFLSQDAKIRQIYEERLKADLDYNTGMADAFCVIFYCKYQIG